MPEADRPWIVRPASARAQREWGAAMREAPDLMAAVRNRPHLREVFGDVSAA